MSKDAELDLPGAQPVPGLIDDSPLSDTIFKPINRADPHTVFIQNDTVMLINMRTKRLHALRTKIRSIHTHASMSNDRRYVACLTGGGQNGIVWVYDFVTDSTKQFPIRYVSGISKMGWCRNDRTIWAIDGSFNVLSFMEPLPYKSIQRTRFETVYDACVSQTGDLYYVKAQNQSNRFNTLQCTIKRHDGTRSAGYVFPIRFWDELNLKRNITRINFDESGEYLVMGDNPNTRSDLIPYLFILKADAMLNYRGGEPKEKPAVYSLPELQRPRVRVANNQKKLYLSAYGNTGSQNIDLFEVDLPSANNSLSTSISLPKPFHSSIIKDSDPIPDNFSLDYR